MSLRVFHIFFISISAALMFGFGFWCFSDFSAAKGPTYQLMGSFCFLSGISLTAYGFWFLRKTRDLK